MRLKNIAVILVVGVIALIVWWNGPEAPDRERAPGTPTRIVSLAPSFTEMVVAVGASDLLVGATSFCKGVPDELPRVGGLKVDVEQILALEPDLVLAIATATQEPTLLALREAGIDVEVQPAETIADVHACVKRVGELLDARKEARRISWKIHPLLSPPEPPADAPRVLFVVDREPLYVAGEGSFVTALLQSAGMRNLFDDRSQSYLAVTIEDVFAREPDVVIDASFPDPEAAAAARAAYWKRWEKLPAIASGRLHAFPQVTPGIGVTEWAAELQKIAATLR